MQIQIAVVCLLFCLPLLTTALSRDELGQFLQVDNGGTGEFCRFLRVEQRTSNRHGLKIEIRSNGVANHLAGQVCQHQIIMLSVLIPIILITRYKEANAQNDQIHR